MLKNLTFGKICFFMGLSIVSICIGINYQFVDGLTFFGASLLVLGSLLCFIKWLTSMY